MVPLAPPEVPVRCPLALPSVSLILPLLACTGLWGDATRQASIEFFTTSRGKVEACSGAGRDPLLASIDAAIARSRTGEVDLTEFLAIEAPLEEAIADGAIDAAEAAALSERLGEVVTSRAAR